MPTRILGLSAYYHDSAACLLEDGAIVAAAQEERFTRIKHDPSFPARAVEYCLREGGITPGQLDLVGFYEKPLVKFSRLIETYVASAPPPAQPELRHDSRASPRRGGRHRAAFRYNAPDASRCSGARA